MLSGSYYFGLSLKLFFSSGNYKFNIFSRYLRFNYLNPIIAPINPPTIAALVSLSPAYLITCFISET